MTETIEISHKVFNLLNCKKIPGFNMRRPVYGYGTLVGGSPGCDIFAVRDIAARHGTILPSNISSH